MIWDRCANAIENNDYEGCQMELLQTLAMETPFTEEEFRNEKKEKLAEKTFGIAMENFKRKTERLAQIANPLSQTTLQIPVCKSTTGLSARSLHSVQSVSVHPVRAGSLSMLRR